MNFAKLMWSVHRGRAATTIFAANEYMALGVYKAARWLGISVSTLLSVGRLRRSAGCAVGGAASDHGPAAAARHGRRAAGTLLALVRGESIGNPARGDDHHPDYPNEHPAD